MSIIPASVSHQNGFLNSNVVYGVCPSCGGNLTINHNVR